MFIAGGGVDDVGDGDDLGGRFTTAAVMLDGTVLAWMVVGGDVVEGIELLTAARTSRRTIKADAGRNLM